jgi:tetratricopeptide (TPR) repeat protein
MRSFAVILCTLFVFVAGLPSKQALSASQEPSATPELVQAAPTMPEDLQPQGRPSPAKPWPLGPAFGLDGPRIIRPQEAETPEPRKNPETPKPKADDKAAKAEALKRAMAPHPTQAAQREQMLEALFKRLAAASDPDEGHAVAAAIQQVWARSQSDTAELLMERATAAMAARQYPLALELFNKIIVLQPTWAEAWNRRATLRFLADDFDGSMADIKEVLKLEPRHFGALAGMATILRKEGLDKSALTVMRKVLALNPQQPELQSVVEKLTLEVEGRGI